MTQGGQFGGLPVWGGALRPENRVTDRSSEPQNSWTGLSLPMKPERHAAKAGSMLTIWRQKVRAASAS